MCLIFVARHRHPRYPLIIAANRDEFYARPASAADWWTDKPRILAGRDRLKGGTWLGMRNDGRWAAITNFRSGKAPDAERSRGQLISDFLDEERPARAFLDAQAPDFERFGGFNMLLADARAVYYASNRTNDGKQALSEGIFGLSNHLLDTPWPKVEAGKHVMADILASHPKEPEALRQALTQLLGNTATAATDQLPDTGVGHEIERLLSSAFIRSPSYGTRATTVVLVDQQAQATFYERRFGPMGQALGESEHHFALTARPRWLDQ